MEFSIGDRILNIIEVSGISKTEFAQRLKVSPAYVSKMVNKDYQPSDRIIDSICGAFNVNEEWLRHGVGEMHALRSQDERVKAWIERILAGRPEDIRYRAVSLLADMPEEWWDILAEKLAAEARRILEEETIAAKVESYKNELEAAAASSKFSASPTHGEKEA